MRYTVGARGSRLSIAQTEYVIKMLQEKNPGDRFEIVPITTKGDRDSRPLFAMDQKGIFQKEVDMAVLEERVDMAVHSLKDVPSEVDGGLALAVPKRGSHLDVLITEGGAALESVRAGAILGTSSLRRAVQVSRARPDVAVRPVRGNIETRISKVGEYDGIILAEAGLVRMGANVRYSALPEFLPSPGQGALAVTSKGGRVAAMLLGIQDADSRAAADAERAISRVIGSGCRFPVGAYAAIEGDVLTARAAAFSIDGSDMISAKESGPKLDAERIGEDVGKALKSKGVESLAAGWREGIKKWNRQESCT